MTAAPTDPAGPTKAASPATATATKTAMQRRFADLGAEGRCALMPFLMAGDPSLQITAEALLALQRGGADLIELGIPYSDPLADGPVIQQAASRALAAGTTPSRVLDLLASLRGQLQIPVVLFTYSNPLLNRGMERFCQDAAAAGAAGLVVLLVAPTTPPERLARIHASSRGFTYLVSVTGVTGMRTNLEARVEPLVAQLKAQGGVPVAVGFGISGPEQAAEVRRWGADGAIVGSALVRRMAEANAAGTSVAEAAERFCRQLRAGLDGNDGPHSA